MLLVSCALSITIWDGFQRLFCECYSDVHVLETTDSWSMLGRQRYRFT